MEPITYPLRNKYQPRGRAGDYIAGAGGLYKSRTGNSNGIKKGILKMSAEDKKRGVRGFKPYAARALVLRAGRLRRK